LKKYGTDNIIGGAEHAFSLPILWQSVRAGKTKDDAMGGKEISEGGGEKFTSIIALEALDGYMILGVYVVEKTAECDTCVRFVAQGECPRVMCETVEYN
jgi:hypothetical protein